MQLTKPLLGIFAVLGTWPNWEAYFDLSRKGQKTSFIALALSLAPLWMVVYGIQTERARITDTEVSLPGLLPFVLIVGLWLFSFPALAYLIGMIMEKMDRVRVWTITRNWTVFGLSLLVGIVFGLVALGALPFMVANGVVFAAYLGLLAADIRLAQKVAGFNWGIAVLIGCVIVAVGMTFVQLAISR
ncbi:MAG: hypothetical protein ABJO36_04910 [Litorimonas sp.]